MYDATSVEFQEEQSSQQQPIMNFTLPTTGNFSLNEQQQLLVTAPNVQEARVFELPGNRPENNNRLPRG